MLVQYFDETERYLMVIPNAHNICATILDDSDMQRVNGKQITRIIVKEDDVEVQYVMDGPGGAKLLRSVSFVPKVYWETADEVVLKNGDLLEQTISADADDSDDISY